MILDQGPVKYVVIEVVVALFWNGPQATTKPHSMVKVVSLCLHLPLILTLDSDKTKKEPALRIQVLVSW